MTKHDPATPPRRIFYDDAPVSTCETTAEVTARQARTAPPASRFDLGEIARSALADMAERPRAEFLTTMLCELRGREARGLLAEARNHITRHLHELITAEYDVEAARMAGQDVAELARELGVLDHVARCGLTPVEFDEAGRCVAYGHPSGAVVQRRFLRIVDWNRSTDRELFWGGFEPQGCRQKEVLQAFLDAIRTEEAVVRHPASCPGDDAHPRRTFPASNDGAAASAEASFDRDQPATPEGIAE